MEVDRRSLALQNRQISIRMEQLTDRMVERTGLSTAQAHLLMRILRYGPEGTTLTELHRQCGYSMAALSNILKRLRKGGYQLREMIAAKEKEAAVRTEKITILKDVYRILALCLGEPPVQFTWRYTDKDGNIRELKDYTPMQFYKEITPADYSPENYIMIMNDPTREYYKIYEIKNYRNTQEGVNWTYLNLPNEDIKAAAIASIKRELGGKWALGVVVFQCVIAWVAASIVHLIGLLIVG